MKKYLGISEERLKKEAREWAEAIFFALILTLIIKTFFFQAFKIPSESMVPTLLKGDKLFVNKLVYRFHEPARWDIVVFKYPEDPKKDFIKRMIALGGDEVEIRDGAIWINGQPQTPPASIRKIFYYNQDPFGGNGQKITVPQDSYFVLGDNSLSSRDSRYWGFVPKKNMVGKAVIRWWPPNRIGKLE